MHMYIYIYTHCSNLIQIASSASITSSSDSVKSRVSHGVPFSLKSSILSSMQEAHVAIAIGETPGPRRSVKSVDSGKRSQLLAIVT